MFHEGIGGRSEGEVACAAREKFSLSGGRVVSGGLYRGHGGFSSLASSLEGPTGASTGGGGGVDGSGDGEGVELKEDQDGVCPLRAPGS